MLANHLHKFKIVGHKKAFNLKGKEWRKERKKEETKEGGTMHYLSSPRGWAPPTALGLAWQPPTGCPRLPTAHQLLHDPTVIECASLSLGPGCDYEELQCRLILLISSNFSLACFQLEVFLKNPAYGRHWISWPMWITGPIFFNFFSR